MVYVCIKSSCSLCLHASKVYMVLHQKFMWSVFAAKVHMVCVCINGSRGLCHFSKNLCGLHLQ